MLVSTAPRSVLLVCLGNICRSPTAEEVLRQKAAVAGLSIKVDSAGTGDWHLGEPPDPRAQAQAKKQGYALHKLVSRQVTSADFTRFDLILAMDEHNLADLEQLKQQQLEQGTPANTLATLALFSDQEPHHAGEAMPDPYQGDESDFALVLARIEAASDAWIKTWQTQ